MTRIPDGMTKAQESHLRRRTKGDPSRKDVKLNDGMTTSRASKGPLSDDSISNLDMTNKIGIVPNDYLLCRPLGLNLTKSSENSLVDHCISVTTKFVEF